MATPISSAEITDAKVLLATQTSSLQPDVIVWFLLAHCHELTEQQLRTLVALTDPHWLLVFLEKCSYNNQPGVQFPINRMQLDIMLERMNPYEIVFCWRHCFKWINKKTLHTVLTKMDPYWTVSLLKQTFLFWGIVHQAVTELFRTVVAQSDSFKIVELLEYLLRERNKSDDPAARPQYYMEWFCMIVERADLKGLLRFLKTHGPELMDDEFRTIMKHVDSKQLSVSFKSLSIAETGSSTRDKIHPYKKKTDKSVIARYSPAQLRTWVNHCDLAEVVSYFEDNYNVLHEAQFGIWVEKIPLKRLTSFLEKNHSKLQDQHFRMVIEELANKDVVSLLEIFWLNLTDEKRRIVFCMAVGWIDFKKLMQVLENHFPRMTVEEFHLITERIVFLMDKNDDLWECFAQFFRNHLLQLTDEQLCIMVENLDERAFQMLEEDEEFQQAHFCQLTDKRLAIIQWGSRFKGVMYDLSELDDATLRSQHVNCE
jgi:hypothetical protein